MENESTEYSKFYVELDCLLDSRLSIISEYGDDVFKKVIENGYHNRQAEMFEGIDRLDFEKRYSDRNRKTLRNATITPMVSLLEEFASATIKNAINSPFKQKPMIVVNVYPYELSKDEKDLILASLIDHTKQLADIEIVDIPTSRVTLTYLKREVTMACMYRYDLWLDVQVRLGNMDHNLCPDVTLLVPRVLFGQDVHKLPPDTDPYRIIEERLGVFIGLQFMDIQLFSSTLSRAFYLAMQESKKQT
jgi:hypothetical protein